MSNRYVGALLSAGDTRPAEGGDPSLECVFRATRAAVPSGRGGVVRAQSERSDARSQFLVSVPSGEMPFFFRIEPPRSVTVCALWTSRSQMASAMVASPIA
jgi:hypothetical protein